MSGYRIRFGTFCTGEEEEEDDDQCYCPSPRKRIGPALGFALTLASVLLCTTLATGRSVPHQTATQTMKLFKGGERGKQVFSLLPRETCSVSSSSSENRIYTREERRLAGPGSHPPSCKSKCGKCVPCKPVRVPIHPGRNRPLEYYPEAWRCKCGNKLYMP